MLRFCQVNGGNPAVREKKNSKSGRSGDDTEFTHEDELSQLSQKCTSRGVNEYACHGEKEANQSRSIKPNQPTEWKLWKDQTDLHSDSAGCAADTRMSSNGDQALLRAGLRQGCSSSASDVIAPGTLLAAGGWERALFDVCV